jgi:predicted  nucleic acid-binding Zn-ribbon protein
MGLRWIIRAAAANGYKRDVIGNSKNASSRSRNALNAFKRAKSERDLEKKIDYISEGLVNLAESIDYTSNAIEPLAEMSFVASLLAESIQTNLDEQTKDIVEKLKR